MTGVFNDPELQRAMKRVGAVHTPGMAEELMREMAPLLAEEGIDIDNLGDLDPTAMNAAIGRAVERRNLELFTPIGENLAMAVTGLRLMAVAIDAGDDDRARSMIARMQPEPSGDHPSIAQMIGVSLGRLDTWHTDPERAEALAGTRIPPGEKRARAAANDIRSLARKGRAFDAIGSLHRRYDGLSIMHGGILAVTGSLQSWAAFEESTVRAVGVVALG